MDPRGVDTRGGHLAALFRWQSGKREQLENFCTEALASAIVAEPGRFLALLEERALLPTKIQASEVVVVEVATQGPTADGKIVDLQLTLRRPSGPEVAVWIEVKIGIGLGVGQLEAYSQELLRVFGRERSRLLVLSQRPEQPARDNLRWQQVRDMITPDAHLRWLDLRTFLEARHVVDKFDEDLSTAEYSSVEPARVVLCKVARAMAKLSLRLVAAEQPRLWPTGFPTTESKILNLIATTFRNGWGFVIGGSHVGARLRLGIRNRESGPTAFVMIKTRKSHAKTRARVWAKLDAITEPRFGPIDAGFMEARGISVPLSELVGQDALVTWWFDGLRVLAEGGVLELCGRDLDASETDPDTEDEAQQEDEDELP